jgi:hypothetical protein
MEDLLWDMWLENFNDTKHELEDHNYKDDDRALNANMMTNIEATTTTALQLLLM